MTTKTEFNTVADAPDIATVKGRSSEDCPRLPGPDSFSFVVGKGFGILPFSLVISAIACTAAHYIFGIPLNQVAVVVSVPFIMGFAFTRILVLVTPRVSERPRTQNVPPLPFRVTATLVALFTVGTFAMLASSPVYYWLGRQKLASSALKVAALGGVTAVFFVVLAVLSLMEAKDLEEVLIVGFWRLWLFPRTCLHRFMLFSHPTKNGL